VFDEADELEALFDPAVFGTAATHRVGAAGAETAVTVLLSRGDGTWAGGRLGGIAAPARSLLVRASELAEVRREDRFVIGAETLVVTTPTQPDSARRLWRCELRPDA
jgi:hypothetical protein